MKQTASIEENSSRMKDANGAATHEVSKARTESAGGFSGAQIAKSKQVTKIAAIREALIRTGYDTLQRQATVLGISRSTAWNLLKAPHKASGLSANTIRKILSSPKLPLSTREIVEDYVEEKLTGVYGHNPHQLRRFRNKLGNKAD